MKKLILISLVLLLIPTLLFGQYRYDGRRVWPGTIGSSQITDATVANGDLASTAIDGSVMLEATRYIWFPASADSMANDGWVGAGVWTFDGSNPPSVEISGTAGTSQIRAFIFDADGGTTGDDIIYLSFVCPDDYETDSMELFLYWFHLDDNGATTDSVEWVGTLEAVTDGEDLFAAGTAITAVYDMAFAADSALYICQLDPEVETIAAGDLITIKLSVDESDSQLDTGEHAHLIGILVEYEAKDE